jgi:hypothetical protein
MQTHARKSSENGERIILFVTSGGEIEALMDSVDVVIEKPKNGTKNGSLVHCWRNQ